MIGLYGFLGQSSSIYRENHQVVEFMFLWFYQFSLIIQIPRMLLHQRAGYRTNVIDRDCAKPAVVKRTT